MLKLLRIYYDYERKVGKPDFSVLSLKNTLLSGVKDNVDTFEGKRTKNGATEYDTAS